MKYGLISDTHAAPQYVPVLAKALKAQGVQALILNGDLGESIEHIALTVMSAAETGLPTYVQPGSHEEVADYVTVMRIAAQKYPNIIDCLKNPKIEQADHHLVFLPGSDGTSGGQFHLQPGGKTGIHVRTPSGYHEATATQTAVYASHPLARGALRATTSMDDLDNLVTDAERTVVICHVPPRFDTISCVDMAYFAEHESKHVLQAEALKAKLRARGAQSPIDIARMARANGYEFKRENRGNEDLGAAYRRNGVTKTVTGHFHESSHRAHTMEGKDAAPGAPYKDLTFMASYADLGRAGIVTIKDDRMAYERLQLRF